MTIPEAKRKERARLSNLFERLSSRLPPTDASPEVTKCISSGIIQSPPIPDDFTTVLRHLSTMTKSGAYEASHSQTRRNPVTSRTSSDNMSRYSGIAISSHEDDDEDCLPVAYPFTFKHMIHKLYRKDDWLRTVKDVLEKSRKDFKPLAECELKSASKCLDSHRNGVKLKNVVSPRLGKKASTPFKGKELRSMSMADVNERPEDDGSLRALKKRCVGIRQSISGNPSDDADRDNSEETKKSARRGSFVFASAISSTELPGEEIYLHFPSPQVSPSESCFSDAGDDTTAPHSPVFPITPTSPTSSISLYTMGCTAGVKRRVSVNHQVEGGANGPIESSWFSLMTDEDLD